jgi:WD40 repeat protein
MVALVLCGIQVAGSISFCPKAEVRKNSSGTVGSSGQQPPELIPERFAPGVVSTEVYSETGCTFTPDGKALYFTRSGGDLESPTIFLSRLEDGNWTDPQKAPLEGFGPHISPDGKKIFISKLGQDEENQRTIELWYAEKEGSGWGALKYHGLGNRLSMSDSLNLYYVDRSDENDRGVIVVQEFAEGRYAESEILGGGVNTASYEAHPCIARDESYIIFDSDRAGGSGKGDLYVSFRKDDGTWGDARNLGSAINTEAYEGYSSISPDGKYLFYSSNKDGSFSLYRVSLDIIGKIRE